MDKIIVKNFGPIVDVELNINKLTMIFGSQATGKSVLAKLLTAVNSLDLVISRDLSLTLQDYNIEMCLQNDTYIRYESDNRVVEYKNGCYSDTLSKTNKHNIKLDSNKFNEKLPKIKADPSAPTFETFLSFTLDKKKKNNFTKDISEFKHIDADLSKKFLYEVYRRLIISEILPRVIYIPAERIIFALISDNIFSLSSIVNLPKCLLRFGSLVENSRNLQPKQDIPYLKGLTYQFKDKKDLVQYNGSTILLSQSASGLQTSIPLALVCNNEHKRDGTFFIVEEPEQNLFPTTQYHLVEYLTERCLLKSNRLLVTTHSPYILSSFDNLIQASNASTMVNDTTVLRKIVPKKLWIDIDNVSAYFLEEGKCIDMIERKAKRINGELLDKASELIGQQHSEILEQMYINEPSNNENPEIFQS